MAIDFNVAELAALLQPVEKQVKSDLASAGEKLASIVVSDASAAIKEAQAFLAGLENLVSAHAKLVAAASAPAEAPVAAPEPSEPAASEPAPAEAAPAPESDVPEQPTEALPIVEVPAADPPAEAQ